MKKEHSADNEKTLVLEKETETTQTAVGEELSTEKPKAEADGEKTDGHRRHSSQKTEFKERPKPFSLSDLEKKNTQELSEMCKTMGIKGFKQMKKQEIIYKVLMKQTEQNGLLLGQGILEILPENFGFLRTGGYLPSPNDVYVAASQIQRFGLRTGDYIVGQIRKPKSSEKYYSLLRIESVNGVNPDTFKERPLFDELTPTYPTEKFKLEDNHKELATRLIDLIAPIGKGQRALIVSPPKAGKTILLKKIANSITANHPDVEIIVLLVDERPEEVTDIKESVKGEVADSTFDKPPEEHCRVAEMVMERAKRHVEQGKDVVILLDSITRLARAYNLVMPSSGRTLSGGIDSTSLHKPKRFFGAARKIREGGSLTIIATSLIDTGSRMDDVIYEEFKGTGNMELHLDRNLSEKRVFPAIDIKRSGTRHEELLFNKEDLKKVWILRRVLSGLGTQEATELMLDRLSHLPTNEEFLNNKDFVKSAKNLHDIM